MAHLFCELDTSREVCSTLQLSKSNSHQAKGIRPLWPEGMYWPTAEISRGPMLNFSTLRSKLTGTPSLSASFDPQCNGNSNCTFQEQVIMKHIPIKRCMKAGLKPKHFYTYNVITLFFIRDSFLNQVLPPAPVPSPQQQELPYCRGYHQQLRPFHILAGTAYPSRTCPASWHPHLQDSRQDFSAHAPHHDEFPYSSGPEPVYQYPY